MTFPNVAVVSVFAKVFSRHSGRRLTLRLVESERIHTISVQYHLRFRSCWRSSPAIAVEYSDLANLLPRLLRRNTRIHDLQIKTITNEHPKESIDTIVSAIASDRSLRVLRFGGGGPRIDRKTMFLTGHLLTQMFVVGDSLARIGADLVEAAEAESIAGALSCGL